MRRPAMFATVFFALGIVIEYYLKIVILWILLLFAMSIFLYLKSYKAGKKSTAIFCIVFIFGGMVLTSVHDCGYEKEYSLLEQEEVFLEGRVICFQVKELEEDKYKYSFLLLKNNGGRVMASGYENYEKVFQMQRKLNGAFVKTAGTLEMPKASTNPGCFDYRLYLKSKKAALLLKCSYVEFDHFDVIGSLLNSLCNKRDSFLYYVKTKAGNENCAMTAAMLFGDKNHMDEEIYKEFQLNGTAHVLATSGLHLAVIYGALNKIFNIGRKKFLNLMLVVFFIAYVAMADFNSSIIRAAMMITVSSAARIFHRRYDLLSSISLSALLLLIWNPYNLFATGFQMTFLAVAIITVTFSKIERLKELETYSVDQKKQLDEKNPLQEKIKEGLLTTGVIQLSMTPYIIYTFNYFSLTSFVANLPVTLLSSYLLLLDLGLMVFFLFFGTIPSVFFMLSNALTKLFTDVNSFTYAKGILTIDMVSPSLFVLMMFYLLFFLVTNEEIIVSYIRREYKKIVKVTTAGMVFCIFVSLSSQSPIKNAQVVFVDVGQGDSIHLKVGKSNVLIDGGGSINYNVGEKTLKPYLLKNGVRNLDMAIATHLHTDHYKGIEELVKCYPVKKLLIEGKAGQVIEIGDDTIEILWPISYDKTLEDENLNSLIFKAEIDGISYLITGDITEEGERMLLELYRGTDKLQCHVLKIAHHGSSYSSCEEFLDAVNPEVAVICVGRNNYGHPGEDVIKRLKERNIKVFRTDIDGAVGIWNHWGKIMCSGHVKSEWERKYGIYKKE